MHHLSKLCCTLILFTNAIKLPVLIDDADEDGPDGSLLQKNDGPREAIVLLMKAMSDQCRFERLMALALTSSTEKRKRDVYFLHDEKFAPTDQTQLDMLKKAGVFITPQPKAPTENSWMTFGDPSSGPTKPSFLSFAKSHPEYDYFWLIEDDAFYTGKWGEFFDAPLLEGNATADLIGSFRVRSQAWIWWKHSWTGKGLETKKKDGMCMIKGKPCLTTDERGQSNALQFMWPVSRHSKIFVNDLANALSDKSAPTQGHHEALIANYCRSQSWCTLARLQSEGVYIPNPNKQNEKLSLEYLTSSHPPHKLQASHIYHPVKCEASAKTGTQALCYANRGSAPPYAEEKTENC